MHPRNADRHQPPLGAQAVNCRTTLCTPPCDPSGTFSAERDSVSVNGSTAPFAAPSLPALLTLTC